MALILNEHELSTSGVIKIKEYFNDRLDILRQENDVIGADATRIRGNINEVKTFQKRLKGTITNG